MLNVIHKTLPVDSCIYCLCAGFHFNLLEECLEDRRLAFKTYCCSEYCCQLLLTWKCTVSSMHILRHIFPMLSHSVTGTDMKVGKQDRERSLRN